MLYGYDISRFTFDCTAPTPAPTPAHDATKIAIRLFCQDDMPQVIQLFKEGMLCYPAQRENPRLLEFIDDSLKTDLSDIKGTYIAPGGNFWIDGQYKFSLRGTKSTYDYGTNNMNKALPSRKPAILESPPPTKSMGDLNSDIVIRQFRVEDLPQVVEVFEAGIWSYEAFRAIPEESEAYLQESLSSDLSDIEGIYITPGGNLWVATLKPDPTKVLGFVGLEPKDNKEGELRRMSVKDTHRRFGVGRKLIAALEKWAHENGFRKSVADDERRHGQG
ncbi:hypothetical protein PC121_g6289 [Phytophthora cactorum]|nr:hypothetical protein PC120_g3945 [Phytophthora cactorum]KAG3081960.1 hypothetical protein PC121_g6289 [Phytophthora cactorum]